MDTESKTLQKSVYNMYTLYWYNMNDSYIKHLFPWLKLTQARDGQKKYKCDESLLGLVGLHNFKDMKYITSLFSYREA